MITIQDYHSGFLPGLETAFFENVPENFAKEEWEDFLAYLPKHASTYFVVVQDEEVLGGGGYHYVSPEKGRLSWDFLAQNAQGKGVGKLLIGHCLQVLQQDENLKTIEVWTSQLAQGFYAKFGFEVQGVQKDYWSQGLDLVRMLRHLDG